MLCFFHFLFFLFLLFFFVYCPSLFLSVRIGWFLLFSHQVHWVFLLSSPFCCWVHPWVFHFSCVFQIKKKKVHSAFLYIFYFSTETFHFFICVKFLCNPSPKTFFWWLHYNLYQIIPTAIPSQWWYPLILFSYSNWDFPHSCYELWFSIIPWLFGVLCFEIQAFV